MVATKKEKICSRDFEQIGIDGFTSEAGLRGRYCRFKQRHFPDSCRTAELPYGLRVYLKNDRNCEMINLTAGLRAHARCRIVRA